MIPPVDLLLSTLERALAVTILPNATNAAAKEEASLGILFVRWLRDVVDHAVDAEIASYEDCRAALAEIADTAPGAGSALRAELAASRALLERPAATAAERREQTRGAKAHLCRCLRAARTDGDASLAHAIRLRLTTLAAREIEREIAFGRATGIDPDGAKAPALAELLEKGKPR